MSKKMDPRTRRTRAMMEEAILGLMEEKDYPKITVQEIARKSGLNRATFYLHYYDKDDLLEKLMNAALDDLRKSMRVRGIEFRYDNDYPHPIFVRLFEKMMIESRFYRIMLVNEKIPYFTKRVSEVIEEFVREATIYMLEDNIEFRVPIEISISYFTAAYLGIIVWWLQNDTPYTATYMASQLTRMSTTGPYVENPYNV